MSGEAKAEAEQKNAEGKNPYFFINFQAQHHAN